jgi:predicted SnoaL-like aldol condensation-catalyzing enzyme
MNKALESKNKELVLEAFDTLFNKRDYAAAEKFWSPGYIQHSAHIPPGREGLFNLIKSIPPTLRYEHGTILAEGDFVIVHGRYSGIGQPVNWIVADIVRIQDGLPSGRRTGSILCLPTPVWRSMPPSAKSPKNSMTRSLVPM